MTPSQCKVRYFYTLVSNASGGDNFAERNPDQELSFHGVTLSVGRGLLGSHMLAMSVDQGAPRAGVRWQPPHPQSRRMRREDARRLC